MKIKFEDEDGYCLTPCPFGYEDGYKDVKLVGSNGCTDCKNFVSADNKNNIVECKGE